MTKETASRFSHVHEPSTSLGQFASQLGIRLDADAYLSADAYREDLIECLMAELRTIERDHRQSPETKQFIDEHPILSRHPSRHHWNQEDADFYTYWAAVFQTRAAQGRCIASDELRQALELTRPRSGA